MGEKQKKMKTHIDNERENAAEQRKGRHTNEYRWTSLYARDRDSKNMLEYNEFAYKKTYDHYKLEDTIHKKAIFQSHILEFADKKTAYNEGRLHLLLGYTGVSVSKFG